MDSLTKIKQLNPTLQNGMINAEEYDILIVGRNVTDTESGQVKKINFTMTTNPTKDAGGAGVTKQNYLRAEFTRSGSVVKNASGEDSFKGSKKPQAGNIFKNTQPNLYNFLLKKLKEKDAEGKQTGFDIIGDKDVIEGDKTVKRPMVRVHATVWGARVSLTVPKYRLTRRDAEGKRINLTGPKYDAKTDKYLKDAPRTAITMRFFADIDDLEEVESLAVRLYESTVMPYETGETVIVETKGNEVKQTVESETITEENEENATEDTTLEED